MDECKDPFNKKIKEANDKREKKKAKLNKPRNRMIDLIASLET